LIHKQSKTNKQNNLFFFFLLPSFLPFSFNLQGKEKGKQREEEEAAIKKRKRPRKDLGRERKVKEK